MGVVGHQVDAFALAQGQAGRAGLNAVAKLADFTASARMVALSAVTVVRIQIYAETIALCKVCSAIC